MDNDQTRQGHHQPLPDGAGRAGGHGGRAGAAAGVFRALGARIRPARAARLLFARLPPSLAQSLLPPLWLAVCAGYVTVGAPALESLDKLEAEWAGPAPTPQGWAALLAAAVEADNEHVIKLSHACHQESLRNPSPLYFAAASRALGRKA